MIFLFLTTKQTNWEILMNKKLKILQTTAILLAAVNVASLAFCQSGGTAVITKGDIVAQAENFLGTLTEAQREKVMYDFNDNKQRQRWSNFPVGAFQRGGVRMGELNEQQRAAAMDMLGAMLSKKGYEKVRQIVEADEVLKNEHESSGAGRRGNPGFGRDNYFISFLGEPSVEKPWMVQFGGHHLGLNITFVGEHGTLAPSHTAAQPAIYQIEGKTIRPLGGEVEKADALMDSLDDSQKKRAILDVRVRNLVLGPGRDGQMIQPEGLKADGLSENQQKMLLDLAAEWTGILDEPLAATKMEQMKANIAETWFAWSGPAEKGSPAYFRIHGPTVFIEFAPQGDGSNGLNHIHTIYRDPTNEYGAKWWRK